MIGDFFHDSPGRLQDAMVDGKETTGGGAPTLSRSDGETWEEKPGDPGDEIHEVILVV